MYVRQFRCSGHLTRVAVFLCLLCAGKITSPLKLFESTHRIYNDTHTKEYNGNDTASWL